MHHANFHMVRLQPPELVLKAGPDLDDVPASFVLPILPDGAEMGLENKLLPPPPKGPAQAPAERRVRRIEIDAVGSRLLQYIQPFAHLLRGLSQESLAAHADFSNPQAGPAQHAVFHMSYLLVS